MSEEQHHDDAEHETGIKTPKQLITVVAAAIIVPVLVIIMLTQFVTLDNKKSPGSEADGASAVAARIASIDTSNPNTAESSLPRLYRRFRL